VFFATPPAGFGPVRGAFASLRQGEAIPKGSLAYRLIGWGSGPDFEAITAYLGTDALHWATWRADEGLKERTLRFADIKEVRFEVIDEYERLLREQPNRVSQRHWQAQVHSFGLIWVGQDGACRLGHHLVLEQAPSGLKPFLEAAMDAYTEHLLAEAPRRMKQEGFISVSLGHTGWIRLHPTHLELKADAGPVQVIPYREIRAVRLFEQKTWILELDTHPEAAPFFGKPFEIEVVRVANLAFLMRSLEPRVNPRTGPHTGPHTRPHAKPHGQPRRQRVDSPFHDLGVFHVCICPRTHHPVALPGAAECRGPPHSVDLVRQAADLAGSGWAREPRRLHLLGRHQGRNPGECLRTDAGGLLLAEW